MTNDAYGNCMQRVISWPLVINIYKECYVPRL